MCRLAHTVSFSLEVSFRYDVLVPSGPGIYIYSLSWKPCVGVLGSVGTDNHCV